MKKDVILAFLGKRNPLQVKINKTNLYLIIDFAEIKIPTTTILLNEDKIIELERKYKCKISRDDKYISIIPSTVLQFNMLSSIDDEVLKRLYEWFIKDAAMLVSKELLR